VTAIARTRPELAAARSALSDRVAVVMTMGALHEGHATLVRQARAQADAVIVTIFLNPLQFAAGEDLDHYPRTFAADLAICEREGVDLVFHPSPDVVYPDGEPTVRVAAGVLGEILEGASRPGHFDGVLTVVAKLFHLTRPDVALFGEKDAQQLALIRRMVHDLDVPVEVIGVPTVRAPDGLALSSRNGYLSSADRETALSLSAALSAGAARRGEGGHAVLAGAAERLRDVPGLEVDYLELVDDNTWREVRPETVAARLVVAARLGTTRLIDNVPVTLPGDVGTGPEEAASCS
jgi:pantoate--beta-alanine ligase